MLSIDEAIARERQEAKEQRDYIGTFDDEYSKMCEVWAEEHEQIANWLEELKVIKEMDLSIPQHFTKEQSDWIKKYCINRNKEFYNKALDDFLTEICKMIVQSENNGNYRFYAVEIKQSIADLAEQLKEKYNE